MKLYIKFASNINLNIAILLAVLFIREEDTVTIEIPSKSGQFEVKEPVPIIIFDTIVEKGENKIVEVPNPVDNLLLEQYSSQKDSIAKLEFLRNRIKERTYSETFSDSVQEINVKSKVIGTLIKSNWIKSKLNMVSQKTGREIIRTSAYTKVRFRS